MKPRSYDWWVDRLTDLASSANLPSQRQAIHDIAEIMAADDPRTRKERPVKPALPTLGLRK